MTMPYIKHASGDKASAPSTTLFALSASMMTKHTVNLMNHLMKDLILRRMVMVWLLTFSQTFEMQAQEGGRDKMMKLVQETKMLSIRGEEAVVEQTTQFKDS